MERTPAGKQDSEQELFMTHLPYLIRDLALILGAAAVTTLLFKRLKQPLVLGYILAGLLIGPNFPLFPTITDPETIRIWADIGVIILLFNLGLEFSIKKLAQVGGTAVITGIFEISGMLVLGYLTGQALGWSTMNSIFLGGIIAISSTTIIFRAFEELGIKTQQFAGVVFGVLIIEDLVAILLMVLLSTLAATNQLFSTEMLTAVLKLVFFLVIWFLGGIFLIPSLLRASRRFINDETLLVISLALCLGMVMLVTSVGFSSALGAFIMGSILAETVYGERIEHLLKPIRDLFGAVFFVSVGMLIDMTVLVQYAGPIALITVAVIVGKAVYVTLGSLIAGQPLKGAIQTGMSLTQIGEFSFIIASLGLSLRVTENFLYPIAVAVSGITAFTTPYLMRAAEPVYGWLENRFSKRTRIMLRNYSAGARSIGSVSDWRLLIRAYLQTMLINTIVIAGIVLLTSRVLLPALVNGNMSQAWAKLLTGLGSLVLMVPFLWALALRPVYPATYNRIWADKQAYQGPLVVLNSVRVVLALGLILFYLNQHFSFTLMILAMLLIGLIWWLMGKRIPFLYDRIEKHFLVNFHGRQQHQKNRPGRNLLPWDAHLAYVEVIPESACVGKTLEELAIRERYGVNIISIERGRITRLVPNRYDRLFPGDKLAVIGTDSQLEQFRTLVEEDGTPITTPVHEVSLERITVDEAFPFVGQSIWESQINEKTQGLIVGIEREGRRLLNPDSTTLFLLGDVIWLAGNTRLIREFQRQIRVH
ncbi:cation:proton antiporter [Nibrella saemangeumensis]|uniref:Cation:proton antiporter n=1 Tax=Nibrella saemangeumensis TaxID=1084526 RepID=A0ABP8N149_9BACT